MHAKRAATDSLIIKELCFLNASKVLTLRSLWYKQGPRLGIAYLSALWVPLAHMKHSHNFQACSGMHMATSSLLTLSPNVISSKSHNSILSPTQG